MKKKKLPVKHGDDIQIDFDISYSDGTAFSDTLRLMVQSGCDGKSDTVWTGNWNGEKISVLFKIATSEIEFSPTFPNKYYAKAEKEVQRITRRFN